MDDRNPYEILKIASNTEPEVIEAVYRMLLARNQKSNVSGQEALEELRQAQWAYEILRDPEKRRAYDERMTRQKHTYQKPSYTHTNLAISPKVGKSRARNLMSTVFSVSVFALMLGGVAAALYFVGAVPEFGRAGNSNEHATTLVISPAATVTSDQGQAMASGSTATAETMATAATASIVITEDVPSESATEASFDQATHVSLSVQGCPSFSSINVRKGPGASYPAVGFILETDCVTLTGRNDVSTWAVIANTPEEDMEGQWIAMSVLTIRGSIESLPVVEAPELPQPTGIPTASPVSTDIPVQSEVIPTPTP